MKKIRKILMLLVLVATTVLCLAFSVGALDKTGYCGDNVSWRFNSKTGELVISGNGDMLNYESYENYDYDVGYSDYSPFYGAPIKKVIIEDGVTSIGRYTFEDSKTIESVTVAGTVEYIGSCAFRNCVKLADITIPDSVKGIDRSAFDSTAYYNNETNWHNNTLYVGNHLIKVKDDVSGAYEVKVGTVTIGDSAFSFCESIESITIPQSVKSIGEQAFDSCTNLRSIVIPGSITEIPVSMFYGCGKLESVTLPEGITKIQEGAFSDCESLKSITIPKKTKEIGSEAFLGCKSLKSVKFSNALTCIGSRAFSECTALEKLVIPEGVEMIDFRAFEGCKKLNSITIPDSVHCIAYDAFKDTGYYNNSSNWQKNVLYIDKHLIKAKENISGSYKIKSGTLTIAGCAFSNCKKLTGITIPGTVKEISEEAFGGCTSLADLTIKNGVENIRYAAFIDCVKLTKITIPESVKSIDFYAFFQCTKLKDVILPDNLKNIDANAFTSTAFYNNKDIRDNGVLYIGKYLISVDDYAVYQDYSVKKGTKVIADGAFLSCYDLKNVNLPDGLEIIGAGAFRYANILHVTIPSSVTNIDVAAFEGCSKLRSVTISDGVKKISADAFQSCEQLKEIYIPATVKTIEERAVGYTADWTEGEYYNHRVDKNFVIKGVKGSAAEKYAKANGITFKEEKNPHLHTYKAKTTKKATYSATGKKSYTCSCGDKFSVITKTKILGTTSKITATKTDSSVTLKWNKVEGATGYRVFRKVDGRWKKLTDTTKLTYTIKSLKANTKYSFAVRAYVTENNKKHLANEYESLSVTTAKVSAKPAQVKNVKATPTATTVKLTWSKVSGVKGYEIFSYNSKTKKYTSVGKTTGTSYTVKKRKANTTYSYAVKAYNVSGKKNIYGKVSSVVKVTTKLATPTVKLTTTKTKAHLSWADIKGETGYEIYMSSKKDSGFTKLSTYKANSTKATKSNLKSGRTYYFKIRAVKKASGKTTYSAYSAVKGIKIK